MPLVANSDLPTFDRLKHEGQEVLRPDRATRQDIRELHIGLLNMMPDAALQATERQFLRMVGACNRIAQFHVHVFTFDEIPRDTTARDHIDKYYRTFESLKEEGLDALILSGANPVEKNIEDEPFWEPLQEVVSWARENVCSTMCSCLATHAIVQQVWGIHRYPLPQKRWGVYSNRVTGENHPLTSNINTRFDAPHSHVFEVNSAQFREHGLRVLAESKQSDLHLATSPDGLRFVFFQGHPEYDAVSLLKEYRREVTRFLDGTRSYPPLPENYFYGDSLEIVESFQRKVEQSRGNFSTLPEFPEAEVAELIDNTWSDTGKAVVNNWLGLIYQLASPERGRVFMEGVDPDNPLGILT
ncbi:MAG: homoserine O-succinyltransferase [Pseudomonadota bacterium]